MRSHGCTSQAAAYLPVNRCVTVGDGEDKKKSKKNFQNSRQWNKTALQKKFFEFELCLAGRSGLKICWHSRAKSALVVAEVTRLVEEASNRRRQSCWTCNYHFAWYYPDSFLANVRQPCSYGASTVGRSPERSFRFMGPQNSVVVQEGDFYQSAARQGGALLWHQ
jgi:hypothetical protein